MIKIKSIMPIDRGFKITVLINDQEQSGVTFLDPDDSLKVSVNGKTYELVGLSFIKEI